MAKKRDFTKYTVGECLSFPEKSVIQRNAIGILRQLQKLDKLDEELVKLKNKKEN